uniref:NADH-ubiquinone oxidoreductase chain 6 n=1 Tax=Tessaratoma papillosa TaxID=236711 RepID=A0A343W901_9HEMI|nr:NADH dehydrogenase subunit 6 [Tessaratoma papillosa]AVZ00841.1 NADH dehydrogenase subunit 6 [Tessaratoma papillosa]
MSILYMMMVSLSLLFLWLKHPLSMGFVLICQTIIIAMLTGMSMGSFLLSYIIVIIMMSGALVLFIYMASVASNEKFQTPVMLTFFFLIMNIMIFMSQDEMSKSNSFMNNSMNMKIDEIMLTKLFNTSTAIITMMMIMYLLLSMIVVSNIASSAEGPLRVKM